MADSSDDGIHEESRFIHDFSNLLSIILGQAHIAKRKIAKSEAGGEAVDADFIKARIDVILETCEEGTRSLNERKEKLS